MYLEDLEVGMRFGGQRFAVDREEMVAFAQQWDPRPIHLVDEAGAAAGFGGLIASGAYTSAILTRLTAEARKQAGDHAVIAALGSKQRLPHAVRPGDILEYSAEITGKRNSRSRSDAGVLETRSTLTNQDRVVVFEAESVVLVERRGPG